MVAASLATTCRRHRHLGILDWRYDHADVGAKKAVRED